MPPPSDRPGSKSTANVHELVLSHFSEDLAQRLNVDQMFILIDGVLPFEACLYYQVLPLYLEGSRLHLGMVSPEDQTAADYARRIVSYLNYSLVSQAISSEALQAVLSAYLNHAAHRQTAASSKQDTFAQKNAQEMRPTAEANLSDRQTLIVDSPDDLEGLAEEDIPPVFRYAAPELTSEGASELTPEKTPEKPEVTETPEAIAPPPAPQPARSAEVPPVTPPTLGRSPTPGLSSPTPGLTPALSSPANRAMDSEDAIAAARRATLLHRLPALQIHPQHLNSPIETLITLPPKQLLHELLGRILESGIGRLYIERQKTYGRVLWSQSGILQSMLERLELPLLSGLLYELKLMAHFAPDPVKTPLQAEIERVYQQQRLLLRFRVMPSKYGEEATVQVLRGAALKFYQQQQLSRLGRDALTIAKQLQFKVNEIRERATSEPSLMQARIEALASLGDMLRTIESQINDLQHVRPEVPAPEPAPSPEPPVNPDETMYL